jgi:hypothetical protein
MRVEEPGVRVVGSWKKVLHSRSLRPGFRVYELGFRV